MLMVVFGAGASYDSFSASPPNKPQWVNYRPPLTNQLFDPRFGSDYQLFPQCHAVIPRLQAPNVTVESVLEDLQQQAGQYPPGLSQLTAIRYYLGRMLWRCQETWTNQVTKGLSNYKTLLDQIARRPIAQGGVCLVTFNYDTLLDGALRSRGNELRAMSDYVRDPFYLIKLHGSINWAHRVLNFHPRTNESAQDVIRGLIDKTPTLDIAAHSFEIVADDPFSRGLEPLFPAVAIPVHNKQGYECPPDHLSILKQCLPQVDKILIIGWKAFDQKFLDTLTKGLSRNASRRKVMVVASGEQGANETIQRIRAGAVDAAGYYAAKGGFSQFIFSTEADEFLKT